MTAARVDRVVWLAVGLAWLAPAAPGCAGSRELCCNYVRRTGESDASEGARPVREGAIGKGAER